MGGVASAKTYAPGALHHIIVRGDKRQRIFSDDRNRDNFVRHLGDIVTETQTTCLVWALMPIIPILDFAAQRLDERTNIPPLNPGGSRFPKNGGQCSTLLPIDK